MTVVKLAEKRPPIDAELVARIKDLLGEAERGEIVALIYAAECADGGYTTSLGPVSDQFRAAGAIARLQYRVLRGMDETTKALEAPEGA